MKIPESFGETLAREWEKLPNLFKVWSILIVSLEILILGALKQETVDILGQLYPSRQQEALLFLVILVLPAISLFFSIILILIAREARRLDYWRIEKAVSSLQALAPKDIKVPEGYELIKLLTRSSFALVFVARDKYSREKYIIKQIKPQKNVNSAQIPSSSRLAAPIRRLEQEGYLFEILKYHNGWTLAEIIELNRNGVGVSGALLTYWAIQLLEALIPLHLNSPPIVHRDVNPSNVLVCSDTLEIVLLDTSCAIPLSNKASQFPVGTAEYSAPEQLRGHAVPASDLYSFGMTLYAINRCEEPPNSSIRIYNPTPLELFNAEERTEKLFNRCIQIDAKKRPQDARYALRFLRQYKEITTPNHPIGELKLPAGHKIIMYYLHWEYFE